MPKPRSGEQREAFISRCMGDAEARASFPRQDQRYAFCNSTYAHHAATAGGDQGAAPLGTGAPGALAAPGGPFAVVHATPLGAARSDTFQGRPFVVVPSVLVRSQVLRNNLGTTYLPADELTDAWADQWNGIPVLVGPHPSQSGQAVSGRSPELWDSRGAGFIFNAKVEQESQDVRRLVGEVWLDESRAAAIPELATIIERVRAGLPVELSTGFGTEVEQTPGTFRDTPYDLVMRPIGADHLVISLEMTGACSTRDGCGLGAHAANAAGEPCICRTVEALNAEGFQIQTLIFPKRHWDSAGAASAWARDHDFSGSVDETGSSYRIRQRPPGGFRRLRTICLSPGNTGAGSEACKIQAVGGPLKSRATQSGPLILEDPVAAAQLEAEDLRMAEGDGLEQDLAATLALVENVKPNPGEAAEAFQTRCMADPGMTHGFPNPAGRAAFCKSIYARAGARRTQQAEPQGPVRRVLDRIGQLFAAREAAREPWQENLALHFQRELQAWNDMNPSDQERQQMLRDALQYERGTADRNVVVTDVYGDAGQVIYFFSTANGADPKGAEYYRCSYDLKPNGDYVFGDAELVRRLTRYEPVGSGAEPAAGNAELSHEEGEPMAGTQQAPNEGKDLAQLATQLTTLVTQVTTLADTVKGVGDRMAALEVAAKTDPNPAIAGLKAAVAQLAEKFESMQSITQAAVNERERERQALVKELAGSYKVPFSVAELETKPIEELRKLGAMARGENYAGRGGPQGRSAEQLFAEPVPYWKKEKGGEGKDKE